MKDLTCKFEDVPEKYKLFGGRALTSSIICDEIPPTCHPLGLNNKIIFAPGIVSGTNAPTSGRISVGGKSPLTGTIKETNAGGIASQKLGKLGIRAIIVEGKPKEKGKFYLLKIDKDGAELLPADDLTGKGMYEVDEILAQRYGKIAVIGIGPAGEMMLTNAGVSINDIENRPGRYAARGGMGAVMGSKGLKAIVIDEEGAPGVKIVNKELFDSGRKKLVSALTTHDITKKGGALNTYGTAVLVNIINEAGGFPTRNFSSGQFEGASKISGESIAEICKKRGGEGTMGHGCHPGCIIKCSNIYPKEDGTHHVSCVEYESDWAFGANCGIDDLDQIAELIRICNDLGLDTIEAGCTIAVAMEGGLINFGDGEGAINLLSEVGKGSPLGRIIGNGTEFTAKALGVSRVPIVKGQSMPAYEPRAIKGIGIIYATSTMGADHTSGYTIAPEILGVGGKQDPLVVEKAQLARNFLNTTALIDSTGYCLFIAFAILDIAEGFEGVIETINGVLGTNLSGDDWVNIGKETIDKERAFNTDAGFTSSHDRVPEFMNIEKLPPHNVTFEVSEEILDSVHK
jgi:aldehyde:ferredoxin oxidoreductase